MLKNKIYNPLIILIFFVILTLIGCKKEVVYQSPQCGNGIKETGEECDDGNLVSNDGCSKWCTLELTEDCTNNLDDNGNGLIDCADPDCDCPSPEICGNSLDDDNDGLIDCSDPECNCLSPEICNNSLDDDNDGLIDCSDPDCLNTQPCGGCPFDQNLGDILIGTTLSLSNKNNETINAPCFSGPYGVYRINIKEPVSLKKEGVYLWIIKEEIPNVSCDMDDIYCGNSPDISYLPPGIYRLIISQDATISFGVPLFEDCQNGIDDDLDGYTDCDDDECQNTKYCPPPEDCQNGIDDDLDNYTDCDDDDCATQCAPPEDCQNGIDDNLDGRTDCHDPDCLGSDFCANYPCIINKDVGVLKRNSFFTTEFSTLNSSNFVALSCGGIGPDYSIAFTLDSTSHIVIRVTQEQGNHSWALLGGGPIGGICSDGELQCISNPGATLPSEYTFYNLPPQKYLIILDTYQSDASGLGTLSVYSYDPFIEICTNNKDDDNDGLIDCADPDCDSHITCKKETVCHGQYDDDNDGLIDCADPDCMGNLPCTQSSCQPSLNLGTLNKGDTVAYHINTLDSTAQIPCSIGELPAKTVSIRLNEPARLRVRLIPQNFSEPALLISVPAGQWSSCTDAPYMCVNVPSSGIQSDVLTPDILPPGRYFFTITPYDEYSNAQSLLVIIAK